MGFVNKLKNFIGYGDEDDFYDEYIDNDNLNHQGDHDHTGDAKTSGENPYYATSFSEVADAVTDSNKVVNLNPNAKLKVVLVKPERFEDASGIADHLNAKRTVVLNLESATKEVTRRLIDFLSGVAYANKGQIKRVANSTYIITPYNVDIMGDLLDELENSGVFF